MIDTISSKSNNSIALGYKVEQKSHTSSTEKSLVAQVSQEYIHPHSNCFLLGDECVLEYQMHRMVSELMRKKVNNNRCLVTQSKRFQR